MRCRFFNINNKYVPEVKFVLLLNSCILYDYNPFSTCSPGIVCSGAPSFVQQLCNMFPTIVVIHNDHDGERIFSERFYDVNIDEHVFTDIQLSMRNIRRIIFSRWYQILSKSVPSVPHYLVGPYVYVDAIQSQTPLVEADIIVDAFRFRTSTGTYSYSDIASHIDARMAMYTREVC